MKLTTVRLSVDTESLISNNFMESDCEDLIFRNKTNVTIPHWVDHGCNTNETIIWLLFGDNDAKPPRMVNITMFSGNVFYKEDPEYVNSRILDSDVIFYFFSLQGCPVSSSTVSLEFNPVDRYVMLSSTESNKVGGQSYHQHEVKFTQISSDPSKISKCKSGSGVSGSPTSHVHESVVDTISHPNDVPHFKLLLCPSHNLELPSQPVLPMNLTSPPNGWKKVSNIQSRFIKITNDPSIVGPNITSFGHYHNIPSVETTRSVSTVSVVNGASTTISAADHSHIIGAKVNTTETNISLPLTSFVFYEKSDESSQVNLYPNEDMFVLFSSPNIEKAKNIPGIRFLDSYSERFMYGHDSFDTITSSSSVTHNHTIETTTINSTSVMFSSSPKCLTDTEMEVMDDEHSHEFEMESRSSHHIPPYFTVFLGEKYEPSHLSDITFDIRTSSQVDRSWTCFGIPFDEPSKVCSGRGRCEGQDKCVCPRPNILGADCGEAIGDGEYTLDYKKILIHYKVFIHSLERLAPGGLEPFPCEDIVENIETVGKDSRCYFEARNSLMVTSRLVITGMKDDVQVVKLYPITKHSQIVYSYIAKYIKPQDISIYVYVIPTSIGVPFICCLCCCCCCLFWIVSCVLLRLSGRVRRTYRYRSLSSKILGELIMDHEMEKKEGNVAKLRINSSLFEIPYEEIKVINTIGEGGSNSTVFKAKWRGYTVAFKCFKTSTVCSDQSKFDEFEREVEILSSVSHPNITDFYGATLKPPRVGIVMEYCKYGDLAVFFTKEGQLFPFIERFRILKEVASAMSYLHSNNIIHRDLKPENVLLNKAFESKLMDFGLSKMFDEMNSEKTVRIGTSVYMAPEVVKGSKYNEKCDVFSFSIMIFTVITNDFQPYSEEEDGDFNIEMKVANNEEFRPEVTDDLLREEFEGNEWLVELMKKCWRDDPKRRPDFDAINNYLSKEKKKHMKRIKQEENRKKRERLINRSSRPNSVDIDNVDDDNIFSDKSGSSMDSSGLDDFIEDEIGSDEEENDQVMMTEEELNRMRSEMKEMRDKLEELHELKMENERLRSKVDNLKEQKRREKEREEQEKEANKKKKQEESDHSSSSSPEEEEQKELTNLSAKVSHSLRFRLRTKEELKKQAKLSRQTVDITSSSKLLQKSDISIKKPSSADDSTVSSEMSQDQRQYWKRILSSAKKEAQKKRKSSRRKKIMFATTEKNILAGDWRDRARQSFETSQLGKFDDHNNWRNRRLQNRRKRRPSGSSPRKRKKSSEQKEKEMELKQSKFLLLSKPRSRENSTKKSSQKKNRSRENSKNKMMKIKNRSRESSRKKKTKKKNEKNETKSLLDDDEKKKEEEEEKE